MNQTAPGTPNHLKIWGLALLLAFPAKYVVWWLLWFVLRYLPVSVLDILFMVPFLFSFLVFAGTAAAIAAILYSRGVFHDAPAGGARPAAQSFGGGAAPSGGLVMTGDGGTTEAMAAEIVQGRRHCTGELYLSDGRLAFVCLLDQSIVKANAGRAVGQQFGLLGALIGALVSSAGSKKRDAILEEARAAAAAVDLEQRLTLSEFSFSLAPDEIELVKSSVWKGSFIKANGTKYVFNQGVMSDEVKIALLDWCGHNNVATEGLA
jgi:hypothetical protein